MNVKKFFASAFKFAIGAAVLLFLGLESLNFFTYTAPADQPYYAYLGFALTSGAFIGYLLIFMWDADTSLKKFIALTMMAVCLAGELATAGFGMRINAWQKNGFILTETDFDTMLLFVQALGFAHGIALVGYFAGDQIIQAFKDDDNDGVPNVFDSIDNRTTEKARGEWRLPWTKGKRIPSLVQTNYKTKQEQITQPNGETVEAVNPTKQPRH